MIRPSRVRRLGLTAFFASWFFVAHAGAQTLNLASSNDAPIQVEADNGIEWQQDNEVLIARGNARAMRGGATIFADVLRAYYKRDASGNSSLHRLDAAGKVRILSQTETIEGDSAVYDMTQAVMVVYGKKVSYRSGNDTLTAEKQLEYYETAQKAVARGNAIAYHDGKRLHGQTLEAYFRKIAGDKSEVYEVRGFDEVVVVTERDIVRADKAVYNVKTEFATLTDNVQITSGETHLEGDAAEINMKTGISRLLSKNTRVRGIIVPQKREPANKAPKAKNNSKGATSK
jgi:lipopolysaccharide export system protein LptA